MLITSLLVGGGAAYLGSRMVQRHRKSKPLIQSLSFQEPTQPYALLTKAPSKSTLIIAASGLAIVGSTIWMASSGDTTPLMMTNNLIGWMQGSSFGPLVYIAIYTVGPLLFLVPATLLSISGGLLYGPIGGMLLATIGGNLSALVAYGIGRSLRDISKQDDQDESADSGQRISDKLNGERLESKQHKLMNMKILEPYVKGMQEKPFVTVLALRFLYLPYDLVNYGAGLLGLKWQPFLLASALGSLPGTLSFVLAGASIQGSSITSVPAVNPATLAASGAIFVGSLAFSRYLNKLQANQAESEEDLVAAVVSALEPEPMNEIKFIPAAA